MRFEDNNAGTKLQKQKKRARVGLIGEMTGSGGWVGMVIPTSVIYLFIFCLTTTIFKSESRTAG